MSVRTSFGNNPALLRLSSTAPGGSGARKHLLRRSIENYDEEDADYGRFLPDDTPMMASITNSVDINPRESISAFTPRTMNSAPMIARSADSKVSGSDSLIYSPSPSVSMNNRSRYSDADEIASELDSVSDNKSKGYTLTSSFDYTQEFSADGDEKAESKRPLGIGERDSVDSFKRAIRNEDKPTNRSGQDKHIPSNDSLESTRTFSNTGESDSTLHYTGGSNVDLSVTVDSNVDGLEGTNDFGASGVIRKADAYEKAAVDTMMTPPQNEERSAHSKNKQHGSSNYSKVSSSSPFGALRSDVQGFHSDIGDDFDESVNSLTLSDSHMDDDLE